MPITLCRSKLITHYAKTTGYMQFNAVVPILRRSSSFFSASTDTDSTVILIVMLLLIVKIIMLVFEFEEHFHELFNMFALSLGNGLDMDPEKIPPRIVFFFLLLGFSQFSSNIYEVITEVKMTKNTFVMLDTLRDIF